MNKSPSGLNTKGRGNSQIRVIMKAKNRALTIERKANRQYAVVTTRKKKQVEVRIHRMQPADPPSFYVSFVFKHQSEKYFLNCKGTKDKPQLELTPKKGSGNSHSSLFKVTKDSERYKFQPYLKDNWFLCVSRNVLELNNGTKAEDTLFVLESQKDRPTESHSAEEALQPIESASTPGRPT
ncbi:uncharacterized protein LOC144694652 [Cetorhinus maximus]